MSELSDKELLSELGVDVKQEKKTKRTPREERIIAGFEEIQRFVEEHGYSPKHGEDNDIFERLYATRLDRIRILQECRDLVQEMDYQGLLSNQNGVSEPPAEYGSDDEILAELGIEPPKEGDVTYLKHVKPRAEIRAAEEIASRTPCTDFESFKAMFEQVQSELQAGAREARLLNVQPNIEKGDFFILQGQKAYIASVGDEYVNDNGHKDARLRVIFDNGTESNLLMRSLQKSLKQDEAGRRICEVTAGPLFDSVDESEEGTDTGVIYVLRSKSDHPFISDYRDAIHKIGVTRGDVKRRIANAKIDPTFLLADVEVVAEFKLLDISQPAKLENLIHKFFSSVRLDIQLEDRFGNPVTPREWFLVPLNIIGDVVDRISDGTIDQYIYDKDKAVLRKR